MKGNLKKCKQRLHDCFACKNSYCQILKDTSFKRPNGHTYKCPFYKKSTDVDYDVEQFEVIEDENE